MKREKTPAVAHDSPPAVGAAIAKRVAAETPKLSLSQSPGLDRCKHEVLKNASCKGLGCVPSHCEAISSAVKPARISADASEQSCTIMHRSRLCVNNKLIADHFGGVGIAYHRPWVEFACKLGSMSNLHAGASLQSKKTLLRLDRAPGSLQSCEIGPPERELLKIDTIAHVACQTL